jgi:hypothetical protein
LKGIFGASLLALAALAAPARAQNITPSTTAAVRMLLAAAVDSSESMPIWTLRRDSPPAAYRRNPAVWTGGAIDLTGKAVWNSDTSTYGTTAISPLHVIYADHVNGLYPAGTIVRFVANDDMAVERLVVSSVRIGATDLDLSTLDAPLPETIHWFKVMPEHWFLKCARGVPGTLGGMPCVVMDGNTQSVAVKDIAGFYPGGFITATPADPRRRAFTRELRVGDSGSPMFILVGRELVLDGTYHSPQTGPEVSSNIPALNAAMHGSGYQVTVADLSAFAPH